MAQCCYRGRLEAGECSLRSSDSHEGKRANDPLASLRPCVQINPDMFIPMADMVEDIMQQSLPGFVDAVKIADIGQGTNPFRFIAFRGLPDMMTDKAYPREEWINQGKSPSPAGKKEGTGELRADGNEEDTDESGDFLVSLESLCNEKLIIIQSRSLLLAPFHLAELRNFLLLLRQTRPEQPVRKHPPVARVLPRRIRSLPGTSSLLSL